MIGVNIHMKSNNIVVRDWFTNLGVTNHVTIIITRDSSFSVIPFSAAISPIVSTFPLSLKFSMDTKFGDIIVH